MEKKLFNFVIYSKSIIFSLWKIKRMRGGRGCSKHYTKNRKFNFDLITNSVEIKDETIARRREWKGKGKGVTVQLIILQCFRSRCEDEYLNFRLFLSLNLSDKRSCCIATAFKLIIMAFRDDNAKWSLSNYI